MKSFIVFVALFTVAVARPSGEGIVRSESNIEPYGFRFAVETADGSIHNAEGQLKDTGTDHEGLVVHGSYSFVADDGKTYTVNYIADENGFQPQGDHLPVGADVY